MITMLFLVLAGHAGPAVAQVLAEEYERGQDPDLVAPGMSAFLAFFALALVVVLLGWSLTRQVRRSEYRNAQRQQERAADGTESDRAEQDAGPGPDQDASSGADKPPPETP